MRTQLCRSAGRFISFWTLTVIVALSPLSLHAQILRCESVHGSSTKISQILGPLQKQLETQGFKLDGMRIVDTQIENRVVGRLEIKFVSHLYEWAPADFQAIWVHNGGLSQKDVNENIENSSQMMGRGYYVSTSPFDSMSYGPALTVFQTKGPVILINYFSQPNSQSNEYASSYASDVNLIKRLQKAGIDGFFNGRTWMSLISARHLKTAERVTDPIFNKVSTKEDLGALLSFLPYAQRSGLAETFGNSTFAGRVLNGRIHRQDSEQIRTFLETLDLQTLLNASNELKKISRPLDQIANEVIVARSANLSLSLRSRNAAGLKALLADYDRSSAHAILTQNKLKINPAIYAMMSYVDIQNLYSTMKGQNSEFRNLDDLFKKIKLLTEARQRVDFSKIDDLKTFIREASIVIGKPLRIRDHLTIMVDEQNSMDQRINVGAVTKNQLKSQKLLTVDSSPSAQGQGKIGFERLSVEYASLKSYPKLKDFVSNELRAQLDSVPPDRLLSDEFHETARGKRLLKAYLTELAHILFSSDYSRLKGLANTNFDFYDQTNPYINYKMFMALHPFEDGNGRAGRLYYQYLLFKQGLRPEEDSLILPLFDLDLSIKSDSLNDEVRKAQIVALWLSTARDRAEFESMIPTAYQVIKDIYKDRYSEFFLY